jgi:hypothetical protein
VETLTEVRNYEALSFTNHLVNILNKVIAHYRWLTTHSSSWTFVHPSSNILQDWFIVPFTHYILAINHTYFTVDFHSTRVFTVTKEDNLSSCEICTVVTGHIITHIVETRTNMCDQLWWFTRQWFIWLPHMGEISQAPTLAAINKWRLLSEYPSYIIICNVEFRLLINLFYVEDISWVFLLTAPYSHFQLTENITPFKLCHLQLMMGNGTQQ